MAKNIFKRGKVYWIRYTGLDGKQKRESVNKALGRDAGFKDAELLLADRIKTIGEGKEPEIKHIPNTASGNLPNGICHGLKEGKTQQK